MDGCKNKEQRQYFRESLCANSKPIMLSNRKGGNEA